MGHKSTFKIVLTSLFAALTCVATLFIRIPSPMGGYVNLGDGIVLLSAYLLGPLYGMAAAGIGSFLADIFSGYPAYAPGTLVIKALVALTAGLIFKTAGHSKSNSRRMIFSIIIGGICAEAVMVIGYFIYSGVFLGYGLGAAADIPGNLTQSVLGIAISAVLTPVLLGSHEIRDMLDKL